MEEKKLTREEIALEVLAGLLGGRDPKNGGSSYHQTAVREAFEVADAFIKERDKKA
jgi:hypothetical protein